MSELEDLRERIRDVTNWQSVDRTRIITDTSDFTRIQRGDVVRISGRDFVIEGNRYETRFGISDQPKYWVFGAIDLATGDKKILKTVFHEEFDVHIGPLRVHCFRSPKKEARVLNLVRGDLRFMQGCTLLDEKDNHVRVVDFINGPSIFQSVYDTGMDHETYYHEKLPGILRKLTPCLEAIQFLHHNGECHGDIRNDHIICDRLTGEYRWIDFDLNQHVSDFDVWSAGNILAYVAGMGISSHHQIMKSDRFSDRVKRSLTADDSSAFYAYRIINLRKLFPYISERLNDILKHFATRPHRVYCSMDGLLKDYRDMLAADFPDSGIPRTSSAAGDATHSQEEDP